MKKFYAIIVLSILSIGNAIYLTIAAFKFKAGMAEKLLCDINSYLSCSELFSYPFTWFFGYPFAMLALFVYSFIIIISIFALLGKFNKGFLIIMITGICGILFNSYIIVNEAIVKIFCLSCLTCSLSILTITIISLFGVLGNKNKKSLKEESQ
ncbi:MAG: vitamin K epoxide reductase family protein [Candidatus Gracilibacteria bacterium]|nr:vitamin K epoxide reductase family protein [Candidatus Gracilibacteria bacterium]